MAITTSGTTLTFNDATTQTTAPVNTNANVTSATAVAGTGISISAVTTTGAATHTVTNSGVTSIVAGTGITISGATGAVTVNATGTGTVTSVATGNGLSGGTITSTGTLVVACPSYNSVGSYAFIGGGFNQVFAPATSFSAGTGTNQVQPATLFFSSCQMTGLLGSTYGYSLSGTWRAMTFNAPGSSFFVACRVS